MFQTLLLGLVLLTVAIGYSNGCSCQMAHKQVHFCEADFVLQVRVKHEEIIYGKREVATAENETNIERFPVSRKYTMKIRKFYKLKENSLGLSRNSSVATMHTSYYGSLCGIKLKTKERYITAGKFQSDELSLNLCGWVEPWLSLSSMQKKYLREIYASNCDCTVSNKGGLGHLKKPKTEICEWDSFSDDGDCYGRTSACIHNKNSVVGECKWHRNDKLKDCRKEVKRRRWEP